MKTQVRNNVKCHRYGMCVYQVISINHVLIVGYCDSSPLASADWRLTESYWNGSSEAKGWGLGIELFCQAVSLLL